MHMDSFCAARLASVNLRLLDAWRGRLATGSLPMGEDGRACLGAWTIGDHRLTELELRSLLLLPADGVPVHADRRFSSTLTQLRRKGLCSSVNPRPSDPARWYLTQAGTPVRAELLARLTIAPSSRCTRTPWLGLEAKADPRAPGQPQPEAI
jgi:hypothetical protein